MTLRLYLLQYSWENKVLKFSAMRFLLGREGSIGTIGVQKPWALERKINAFSTPNTKIKKDNQFISRSSEINFF